MYYEDIEYVKEENNAFDEKGGLLSRGIAFYTSYKMRGKAGLPYFNYSGIKNY